MERFIVCNFSPIEPPFIRNDHPQPKRYIAIDFWVALLISCRFQRNRFDEISNSKLFCFGLQSLILLP